MEFNFIRNDDLPQLAWIAAFQSGKCLIEHGSTVETSSKYFVEGVWDGRFADGKFAECETFFGSGAILSGSDVVFVPSSATTDFLYYTDRTYDFLCSNSLPFLLAAIGDELEPTNGSYGRINLSILNGIHDFERPIPTRRGYVHRLMYHNLIVNAHGAKERSKPLPPSFQSYEQYVDYLERTLNGLVLNAKDCQRRTPLKVLTTQSTGYDSTAINALVHKGGIDLALTIEEPKEKLGLYGFGSRGEGGKRQWRPDLSGSWIGFCAY